MRCLALLHKSFKLLKDFIDSIFLYGAIVVKLAVKAYHQISISIVNVHTKTTGIPVYHDNKKVIRHIIRGLLPVSVHDDISRSSVRKTDLDSTPEKITELNIRVYV